MIDATMNNHVQFVWKYDIRRRTKEPLDESERGEGKSWLKA